MVASMNFRTAWEEYLSLIVAVCACKTVCSAAPYVCSTEVSLCCINSEYLGLEQKCAKGSYAPTPENGPVIIVIFQEPFLDRKNGFIAIQHSS